MKTTEAAPRGGSRTHAKSRAIVGLAPWNPRTKSRVIVAEVNEILDEYADYLPMTGRQIFYRMCAVNDYPKTEDGYRQLGEKLKLGRRAGLIPWEAIRDDGLKKHPADGWGSRQQFVATWRDYAEQFTLDPRHNQPRRIEVWVEAKGMVPLVAEAVNDLGVDVYSSSGYDGVTGKYDAARRFDEYDECGLDTVILHVGDHDPSGVDMFRALIDDVRAFLSDFGAPADCLLYQRVAITPEQAMRHNAPSVPAKGTDSRSKKWAAAPTWQAEALPPDELIRIIRTAAIEHIDMGALEQTRAGSVSDREALIAAVNSAVTR